jgi:hypothetical protein
MANTVNLEFAGDAAKLARAGKQAEATVTGFDKSVTDSSMALGKASKESEDYTSRVGKLGAAVDGASTAVDDAGAAVQALADFQDAARAKAARLERATLDMAQAQEDANQAFIDGRQAVLDIGQAEIDAEQATLDAATAQKDYNAAVKEHGKGSDEAKQASLDLKQAQQDLAQSHEDVKQAQADSNQATIDAKGATLDLAEAQKEAHPPDLQVWADQLNMITPILSGLIGIVGLVTAVQWAWNAAQLASPVTWIVLGIVALIAVIVLLVKNWDWVKKAGAAAWDWIKKAASNTWDFMQKIPGWIGKAFGKVSSFITAPFRLAFNYVADAWNNTIGRLSWSVPGWVPGIGGNSISVPHIPKFHSGGVVPGTPGTEVVAMLQAGERVQTRGGDGASLNITIRSGGTAMDDLLVEVLSNAIGQRGGNVQAVLGRGSGG